ncbi:PEP-CTERM sorting domain-containing protein [Pelomonas sp. KK5]|uniref:PEP-CTERM sorting domain-containing protein n=1 Tax=Pelomonas sp. KK5 TaxID=1855730 RepID=UPI00097BCEB1|nr:PEP-CTERM sorting domain-containing protein [Pelomonas sp. KK5]
MTKHLIALAALLAIGSAQATTTYDFGGVIETGVLTGTAFSGQFSFDETLLSGSPDFLAPSALTLNFNGAVYTLATAEVDSTGISFDAGKPVGIDAIWGSYSQGLVLSSGFGSPYLADTAGNSGSLAISASPVPEPSQWMLMVAGMAALGAVVRRRSA